MDNNDLKELNGLTPEQRKDLQAAKDVIDNLLGYGSTEIQSEKSNDLPVNLVYGIGGLAKLFNCSKPTAQKIKNSGKIDAALSQCGRVIVCRASLALELAGKKNGGRR